MTERVARMKVSPATVAFAEVIERLGKIASGLAASTTSGPGDRSSARLLKDRLREQVRLDDADIDELDLEQAVDAWIAWQTRPR